MPKALRLILSVSLASYFLACGAAPESDSASDVATGEHLVLDDRQADKPLRLGRLVVEMDGAPRPDIANNTIRADWRIHGILWNETDTSLPDVEVHVKWYDAAGRRLDSGDAFVEYTMSETAIASGRLAKFRFRSTTAIAADDFVQLAQELLQTSKVDLQIRSAGRAIAYAPGDGWERLRNPPMRPATAEEIVAIRRAQEEERAAEAKGLASEHEMMNRIADSYIRGTERPAPVDPDVTQESADRSGHAEPRQTAAGARESKEEPTSSALKVGAGGHAAAAVEAPQAGAPRDQRAARITAGRLQTLRQTIQFDSADHTGAGGSCVADSEGSWSSLRGAAIKELTDLSRVSPLSGADRDRTSDDLQDGWGSQFRFVSLRGCNVSFLLWSAGPNRVFDARNPQTDENAGSGDDIILVSDNGTEHWVNRP